MDFLMTGPINTPSSIIKIAEEIRTCRTIKVPRKAAYYNIPAAFDIETTSFSEHSEKRATMYAWVAGFNGLVVVGRTWDEFATCMKTLSEILGLSLDKRLVVYVHNLAFEFEFIGGRFEWENVFSLRKHKPVYAVTKDGIEFRCSYILSRYSLEEMGKHLTRYPTQKMVGDLDYSKPRHTTTPLTDQELKYIEQDARVVMSYIQERIEIDGGIHKIPLTATGYVRKYCRSQALYNGLGNKSKEGANTYFRYMDIMRRATLTPSEYAQLKRAFQGGFTHASAWKSGKILEGVTSYDFTSSYPAVMVSEKFPMSRGENVTITSREQFEELLTTHCCIFDVEITGLSERLIWEHPLSISRCKQVTGDVVDNGRLVKADHLITTLTEQDYTILKNFYHWDKLEIGNFRAYRKSYLPTSFVKAILTVYKDKTELKGVDGREVDYNAVKELLNSLYGMSVTDIVRDEIIYNHGSWKKVNPNVEEVLEKYNTDRRRFLFYPWGVWVTAYARRNLFSGIIAVGPDYVYSDTDSIKILNGHKHMEYIERYNEQINRKIKEAMDYHGFPLDMASPVTIKGKTKPIGVWDFDGYYELFKTLGAKRYLTYSKEDGLHMTVAGLGKRDGLEYLKKISGGDIRKAFDIFCDGFEVPPGEAGKLTHTYLMDRMDGTLIDYLGTPGEYHETGGVHLEPAGYSTSLSAEYAAFLRGITEFYE